MTSALDFIGQALWLGVGATAILDLWAAYVALAYGARGLDYAMVGRWLGHLPSGRFRHESIGSASPIPGEQALGWIAHYGTGVAFAAVLLGIQGQAWVQAPSIAPALLIGLASVVFPYFVLQPALGLGVAASRTPDPTAARLRSLGSHAMFGLGLYVTGWAASIVAN